MRGNVTTTGRTLIGEPAQLPTGTHHSTTTKPKEMKEKIVKCPMSYLYEGEAVIHAKEKKTVPELSVLSLLTGCATYLAFSSRSAISRQAPRAVIVTTCMV